MADIVKDVVKVAAPVVGGIFGGTGGAMAGAAVSGMLSGSDQQNAIRSAANQSADATNRSIDLQRYMYDTNLARNDAAIQRAEPWRIAGTDAVNSLRALTMGNGLESPFMQGFDETPFTFQSDPGYDFRLREGRRGLERSAATRGGYLSGNALKALDRYNQDYASGEYSNAYNRWSADQTNRFNRFNTTQGNQFNRLASIAGLGQNANNQIQNANNQIGAAGANYANQAGNLAMNNAYTQGNAGIAASNVNNSMYSGLGNALAYGIGSGGGGNLLSSMYSGLGGMGSGIGANVSSTFSDWSPFDYSGYNSVADYIDPF